MKSYILQAFLDTPWAILPSKLAILQEVVARHVRGEKLSAEEIESVLFKREPVQGAESVAVLSLAGTIVPRADMVAEASGATSMERLSSMFSAALNDAKISAILLDVDSPGGQVGGVAELSNLIYEARGKKPIVAVANYMMASAAYWVGSAADDLVVSPSAQVGSIGVFTAHVDMSRAMESEGVAITLISQGKYKTEGNPYEPLGEAAKVAIQAQVDAVYANFVRDVARNRDVSVDAVRTGFGEGRLVGAEQAVSLGMADRVGTYIAELKNLENLATRRRYFGGYAATADFEREVKALRDQIDLYKE